MLPVSEALGIQCGDCNFSKLQADAYWADSIIFLISECMMGVIFRSLGGVFIREYVKFVIRMGRFFNIFRPKTYNEKIYFRKFFWRCQSFVLCSDKLAVRDYVKERVGGEHLISVVYAGDSITAQTLKCLLEEHGDIVVKANHNSGPVEFLSAYSDDRAVERVCISIKKQLSMDYGARSGEGWYSKIDRKVLVEKRIGLKNKELLDYKFHVFSQGAGKEPIVIVHVDFGRQSAHRRSYFDVDLNLLPFRVLYAQGDMAIEKPTNYELMVDIAKKLAEPFSYVRVDLYNVEGKIFFGELTFAPGSGRSRFYPDEADRWLGTHWKCDPRV